MKNVTKCSIVPVCLLAISAAHAQIPDAGFESWRGTTPTGWVTNNSPGAVTVIFQTTDAHSGNYAIEDIAKAAFGVVIGSEQLFYHNDKTDDLLRILQIYLRE